ncbi:TPA: hypothetical protein ACOL2D_004575 [Vibrio parahaemolyticus]
MSVLLRTFNRNFQFFKTSLEGVIRKLDAAANVQLPATWVQDPTRTTNDSCVVIKPSEPICLTGISQKGNSRSKKISVFLDGHITLRSKDKRKVRMSNYGTKLLYCIPRKSVDLSSLKVSGGFHFDFDINTQPAHPVFHMQHDNSVLVDKIDELKHVHTLEPLDGENRFFRIPTAQMDILSTLIMIIADHFVDKDQAIQCEEFSKLIHEVEQFLVDADFQPSSHLKPFNGYLEQFPHLNSISWYCEVR